MSETPRLGSDPTGLWKGEDIRSEFQHSGECMLSIPLRLLALVLLACLAGLPSKVAAAPQQSTIQNPNDSLVSSVLADPLPTCGEIEPPVQWNTGVYYAAILRADKRVDFIIAAIRSFGSSERVVKVWACDTRLLADAKVESAGYALVGQGFSVGLLRSTDDKVVEIHPESPASPPGIPVQSAR